MKKLERDFELINGVFNTKMNLKGSGIYWTEKS